MSPCVTTPYFSVKSAALTGVAASAGHDQQRRREARLDDRKISPLHLMLPPRTSRRVIRLSDARRCLYMRDYPGRPHALSIAIARSLRDRRDEIRSRADCRPARLTRMAAGSRLHRHGEVWATDRAPCELGRNRMGRFPLIDVHQHVIPDVYRTRARAHRRHGQRREPVAAMDAVAHARADGRERHRRAGDLDRVAGRVFRRRRVHPAPGARLQRSARPHGRRSPDEVRRHGLRPTAGRRGGGARGGIRARRAQARRHQPAHPYRRPLSRTSGGGRALCRARPPPRRRVRPPGAADQALPPVRLSRWLSPSWCSTPRAPSPICCAPGRWRSIPISASSCRTWAALRRSCCFG